MIKCYETSELATWLKPRSCPSIMPRPKAEQAMPALLQDNSLLQMPPWCNPWLLAAMALSFGLHFLILYVPFLAGIFSIVPLSFNEWLLVIMFAFPVVLIDEALKFVGRTFVNPPTQPASLEAKKRQ